MTDRPIETAPRLMRMIEDWRPPDDGEELVTRTMVRDQIVLVGTRRIYIAKERGDDFVVFSIHDLTA